jgi:hypothetical protein
MRLRPEIRVLFVSGYSDEPPSSTAERFRLVSKPFSEDVLLETIRDVLDTAQTRIDTT